MQKLVHLILQGPFNGGYKHGFFQTWILVSSASKVVVIFSMIGFMFCLFQKQL